MNQLIGIFLGHQSALLIILQVHYLSRNSCRHQLNCDDHCQENPSGQGLQRNVQHDSRNSTKGEHHSKYAEGFHLPRKNFPD